MAALFDSHCHLDFPRFDEDRDAVVERARAAGLDGIVVPGVHPDGWAALPALRARYPEVAICVGIHPMVLPELTGADLDAALGRLHRAARELGAIALGEVGFDGGVEEDGVSFERQAEVVDAHLQAASRAELPVVFHILNAHGPALAHLERHGPLDHGGVVHSYSGSAELVDRYVALNLHISFAASVTRRNAKKPLAAVARVPADRLLIETDAPDQTPTGAPGRRNEPSYLPHILAALASARPESPAALAHLTRDNARRLFRTP